MAEYYYFVSSLPSVWLDKEAPISYEEFLNEAKGQLSKSDYQDLLKASFSPDSNSKGRNKIVQQWDNFIFKLNELLTEARAKKLGILDSGYHARCERDSVLEEKIKSIIEEPNALEAEKKILSMYFDFLDHHQLSSPFSTDALMIYGLKLQIKEKENSFDKVKGKAEFDRLFSDIQRDIFHKE